MAKKIFKKNTSQCEEIQKVMVNGGSNPIPADSHVDFSQLIYEFLRNAQQFRNPDKTTNPEEIL